MARAAKQVWIPSRKPWGGRHERRPGLGWVRAMRAKLLRSSRSQAVKLISVVVFRFCQKGVKLSRGDVILKLAVPCGCIECRKPAPELGQGRGFESFDSLLQGFQIGHVLSVRFTTHQSVANRLASPPPQTANGRCTAKQQLVCNTTAGVQLNSRAARLPGSPARAATEIALRHRALAFVAFVARKPQTQEGFGGGAGAAATHRQPDLGEHDCGSRSRWTTTCCSSSAKAVAGRG